MKSRWSEKRGEPDTATHKLSLFHLISERVTKLGQSTDSGRQQIEGGRIARNSVPAEFVKLRAGQSPAAAPKCRPSKGKIGVWMRVS